MHRSVLVVLALVTLLPPAARAQVEIERRRPAPARGTLSVENDFGAIVVRATDRAEVVVRGTLAAGAEDLDFDVDKEGASVSVSVPEAWFHAPGEDAAFRSRLEIEAPAAWSVEAESVNATIAISGFKGSISVESVNGSVKVEGPAGEIEIETMTGAIEALARAAPMDLRTISGAIVARGATGEVRIETASGIVDLSGSGLSRVEIDATTGKVSIEGSLAARGGVDVETFSSPVTLTLPRNARAHFDLQTFAGEIRSDFCAGTPVVRERFEPFRQLRCATGPDDFEIEVRTHSGDIAIAAQGGAR